MSIIINYEKYNETDYVNLYSFRDFVNVDDALYLFEPINNTVYSSENIFSILRLLNNSSRLRFRIVNANPIANRNKGRICIDNIFLYS